MADRSLPAAQSVETYPGRTVTVELSAAQLAHIRVLLFEDLQKWAEALTSEACRAAESGGRIVGIDVRNMYRGAVVPAILDRVGWDVAEHLPLLRWLHEQATERMTEPGLLPRES